MKLWFSVEDIFGSSACVKGCDLLASRKYKLMYETFIKRCSDECDIPFNNGIFDRLKDAYNTWVTHVEYADCVADDEDDIYPTNVIVTAYFEDDNGVLWEGTVLTMWDMGDNIIKLSNDKTDEHLILYFSLHEEVKNSTGLAYKDWVTHYNNVDTAISDLYNGIRLINGHYAGQKTLTCVVATVNFDILFTQVVGSVDRSEP